MVEASEREIRGEERSERSGRKEEGGKAARSQCTCINCVKYLGIERSRKSQNTSAVLNSFHLAKFDTGVDLKRIKGFGTSDIPSLVSPGAHASTYHNANSRSRTFVENSHMRLISLPFHSTMCRTSNRVPKHHFIYVRRTSDTQSRLREPPKRGASDATPR